jgi:hypothetical protein
MGKAMSIAGMVTGGLVALIFTLDLALKLPFGRKVPMMDIGYLVCGITLAYLSWSALRESR